MNRGTGRGSPPLVSVIMPTHNRAHTLPRAIRSVLAQTWDDLELIIADDGSTDGTAALIANIADPRVKYFRHRTNRGAAAARNLGLAYARGDYIAFQDSDDEWLLDKLSMQIEALRAHGGAYGATFGGKLLYGRGPDGRFGDGLSAYRPHNGRSGRITSQLLAGNLISPQTLLAEAGIVREAGLFDERLPSNEDWEFMLRLSMKTRVLFTNRPVVVAYISHDSITLNRHSHALAFMTIVKKHNALYRLRPRIYAERLFTAARYLHQIGRYRAAQKLFWRALRIYPWSVRSWVRLMHARFSQATAGRAATRTGRGGPAALQPGSGQLSKAGAVQRAAGVFNLFPSSRNLPERHVQRPDTH